MFYTLSTRISPRVSSIIQNQTRAFNLIDGDLVVDVGQHVEHLVMVQHGGVRTQTMSDLLGQDLEICSQEAR